MSSDDQRPPQEGGSFDHDHDGAPHNETQNETESVESYRRAHEVIERMRADERPDRASASDDDLQMDLTAALLRSATPGVAEVDPAFAARLLGRLEAVQTASIATGGVTPIMTPPAATTPAPNSPDRTELAGRRAPGVSRRGLMLGGLSAAAAAVIGGAAGMAIEAATQSTGTSGHHSGPPQVALIPDGIGAWVAVAQVADVPVGTVIRFQTDAVIGYLRHAAEGFIALSGVCTHMACLLQWNGIERTFDCPCHGSRFLETGRQAPGARYAYPPLPEIKTRVDNGIVWVYVISPAGSTPDTSGNPSSSRYGA